jgi:hypothetical protein
MGLRRDFLAGKLLRVRLIKVEVQADISQNGHPVSGDAVEACLNQCVADAVEGSFDEYPKHLRPLLRLKGERINEDSIPKDHYTRVRFSFGLPDELFPIDAGGLQLLINLLAGDMFPAEVSGCTWSNVRVLSVELPPDIWSHAYEYFRDRRAYSIDELRALFALPDDRPLLAFSLKPRVGLTYQEVREMTLDVLKAGFNLVELDARNLALRSAPLNDWVELGIEAAQVGSHRTAFSPNFSVPPPQLLEITQEWTSKIAEYGPPVIKVDGGLDGLSSIQALRTSFAGSPKPVVTCYPILRSQLSSAIGDATWVDFLGLSGVDIIYPGGRPAFPNERRPVWAVHAEGWSKAARAYDKMLKRGWPMPTIAGGIHPGHLHACYELLGPLVAYFLGGAVALHPKSPKAGAELCVRVLQAAIELATQAQEAGDVHADDIPARLLREVENTYYPKTVLNYYSPANVFAPMQTKTFVPQTFYRRSL